MCALLYVERIFEIFDDFKVSWQSTGQLSFTVYSLQCQWNIKCTVLRNSCSAVIGFSKQCVMATVCRNIRYNRITRTRICYLARGTVEGFAVTEDPPTDRIRESLINCSNPEKWAIPTIFVKKEKFVRYNSVWNDEDYAMTFVAENKSSGRLGKRAADGNYRWICIGQHRICRNP